MTTTSQATQSQAEQFLARQGIKFRVVQAKRGPGEWNVTFSRHGGGRLKLDFLLKSQPGIKFILTRMMLEHPSEQCYTLPDESEDYKQDLLEFGNVTAFFTPYEIKMLLMLEQYG